MTQSIPASPPIVPTTSIASTTPTASTQPSTQPSTPPSTPPTSSNRPPSFEGKAIPRQNSDEVVHSAIWKVVAKVVQYTCGAVILSLGILLAGFAIFSGFVPFAFTGTLLMSGGLVGTACWMLFRECFATTYPIEPLIENLNTLHRRLTELMPDAEQEGRLFTIDEIPLQDDLQEAYEIIDNYSYLWDKPAFISNADRGFDIIGVNKKAYLKLPLTIQKELDQIVMVGVDVENGELVAISEARSWAFDDTDTRDESELAEQFRKAQVFPKIFEVIKQCEPGEDRGGVLPVYHCIDIKTEEQRQQFIIQKLVYSKTLEEELKNQSSLTEERKKIIAQDLFIGLLTMHRKGLLHKDVRAENVLVGSRAYLSGFHFTIKASPTELDDDPAYAMKRESEGPPEYKPPETYFGREYDEKSEVYAFGLLLYQLFKGAPAPIVGEIRRGIAIQQPCVFNTLYDFVDRLPWDEEPPEQTLDHLLYKMIHPDPQLRLSLREAYTQFIDTATH